MKVLPSFIRCRNCGKYIQAENAVLEAYCSLKCTIRYTACINCGSYFQKTGQKSELFCSNECGSDQLIEAGEGV